MPSDDSSEKREKNRIRRLQVHQNPDYEYWCKLSSWGLNEAFCLLYGIDPDSLKKEYVLSFSEVFGLFDKEMIKTYWLIERAYSDDGDDMGAVIDVTYHINVGPPVKPIKFLEWAKRKRLSIPDQLIEQFDGLNNPISEDAPPYLDPDHEYYPPFLHIAVLCWIDLYKNKKINPKRGHKSQIKAWLRKNFKDLSDKTIEQIATLINPKSRKRGGSIPVEISDSLKKPMP